MKESFMHSYIIFWCTPVIVFYFWTLDVLKMLLISKNYFFIN